MSKRSLKNTQTDQLLCRLRGKVFRASRLLEEPDNRWRRRKVLDSLVSDGKRIGQGEIMRLSIRIPYGESPENSPLVFPGNQQPRKNDLKRMAQLAGNSAIAETTLGRLVVIDLETTGLLDRPETVAFLVGLGYFGTKAFALEQYFLEDFESEPEFLQHIEQRMEKFDVILSYNGITFDLPLLRKRFAFHAMDETVWQRPHWDVLQTARTFWRKEIRSHSLSHLESDVFKFRRHRDIKNNRIPQVYHDYLGGRRAERLAAVFDHNAQDILSTAAISLTLARCGFCKIEEASRG